MCQLRCHEHGALKCAIPIVCPIARHHQCVRGPMHKSTVTRFFHSCKQESAACRFLVGDSLAGDPSWEILLVLTAGFNLHDYCSYRSTFPPVSFDAEIQCRSAGPSSLPMLYQSSASTWMPSCQRAEDKKHVWPALCSRLQWGCNVCGLARDGSLCS